MKKIALGNTGLMVSRIGLGTVKIGRNQGVKYPSHFELPSDNDIKNLLSCAQELGVNLLDTAPAYGTSEERLGKLLIGKRSEWLLSTKVGEAFIDGESSFDFSEAGVKKSVERSLQRLKTDYLDIVLVHSNGDDEEIMATGIFSTLQQMKTSGMIRAFGISTKTIAGGLLAVDQSDVVMVTYNPLQTEEQPVIAYAHQKNKGVFIKKALVSGHIEKIAGSDPVKTALQFSLKEPGVSSVILGTLNVDHLKHAVHCTED